MRRQRAALSRSEPFVDDRRSISATLRAGALAAVFAAAPAATVHAQMCPEINFECCPVNTPITTYAGVPGVTFSSCGLAGCTALGPPTIQTILAAPSPTRALVAARCSNEFYTCICANFTTAQKFVKLQVTAYGSPNLTVPANITVRAYNALGTAVFTKTAKINPPDAITGEYDFYTVQISRTACDITRVEICGEPSILYGPAIDDFRWGNGSNTTPPTLFLTNPSPQFLTCYCPTDTVTLFGTGCNTTDCEYSELLEVSDTGVTNSFVPLAIANNPRKTCVSNNTLWSFPASLLPGNATTYYLHLTGSNLCGAQKYALATIKVDRNAPLASLSCPPNNSYIATWCEPLKIQGAATDECSLTWSIYAPNGTAMVRIAGPVGAAGTATSPAAAAPTVFWSPPATLPDGPTPLSLQVVDGCGRTTFANTTFNLDNTPPSLAITNPVACTCVCPGDVVNIQGHVYDANIKNWDLYYFDFNAPPPHWVPLTSGTTNFGSPASPATFITWVVPQNIPQCCSMLRLRARDLTDPHPCTGKDSCNNREVLVPIKFRDCGQTGDFNHSGTVSVQDIFDFLAIYFAAVGPCP